MDFPPTNSKGPPLKAGFFLGEGSNDSLEIDTVTLSRRVNLLTRLIFIIFVGGREILFIKQIF